jgi:hypothetical protein
VLRPPRSRPSALIGTPSAAALALLRDPLGFRKRKRDERIDTVFVDAEGLCDQLPVGARLVKPKRHREGNRKPFELLGVIHERTVGAVARPGISSRYCTSIARLTAAAQY